MRNSVDSGLKQSCFAIQKNVTQSWRERHPAHLCEKPSMVPALQNGQPGSARKQPPRHDVNLLIDGSSGDEDVSPRWGFHKTEAGVELEENRCSWVYPVSL